MNIEETSAIILAGGHSSRMGTDKAKLRVGEKTLLELMVEKVRHLGISEIVISGGISAYSRSAWRKSS